MAETQFRFSFPRPGPAPEPVTAWAVTFDAKHPLCGFAVRKLANWRPDLSWGPVLYHPTLESAHRDLPTGRLLCLMGHYGARLLRERPAAWGEIREVWF